MNTLRLAAELVGLTLLFTGIALWVVVTIHVFGGPL